jgi:glycerophosphoryl diester phosphodiesterase
MVHHDPTLERTTNGTGRLNARSAAELAALDAGHWFRGSSRPPGPRQPSGSGPGSPTEFPFRGHGLGIPTLVEVLERYPAVPLIIELKTCDGALARKTIDALRAADAVERVVLGSFYYRVLRAARKYEPRIRTGAAREETRWALYRSRVRWPLGRPRYREFQVPECVGRTTIVTPAFIAHAHRSDLPVKVWTVNEPADMDRLLAWGVDGIISDRPDVAVEAVRAIHV